MKSTGKALILLPIGQMSLSTSFEFGDTPYDGFCSSCNTCITDDNITIEEQCLRFHCILLKHTMSELPGDNTCTYEGPTYQFVRENLIPYMNAEIAAGEAVFIAHAGDILGETQPCELCSKCFFWYYSISNSSSISTYYIFGYRCWLASGVGVGKNTRCNPYSFASRSNLFAEMVLHFWLVRETMIGMNVLDMI